MEASSRRRAVGERERPGIERGVAGGVRVPLQGLVGPPVPRGEEREEEPEVGGRGGVALRPVGVGAREVVLGLGADAAEVGARTMEADWPSSRGSRATETGWRQRARRRSGVSDSRAEVTGWWWWCARRRPGRTTRNMLTGDSPFQSLKSHKVPFMTPA